LDKRDAETKDDDADCKLSANGSELTVLDSDDTPGYHDGSHHYD